jgi:hypothetical protein
MGALLLQPVGPAKSDMLAIASGRRTKVRVRMTAPFATGVPRSQRIESLRGARIDRDPFGV